MQDLLPHVHVQGVKYSVVLSLSSTKKLLDLEIWAPEQLVSICTMNLEICEKLASGCLEPSGTAYEYRKLCI